MVTYAHGGASFLDAETMEILGHLSCKEMSEAKGGLWVKAHPDPAKPDEVIAVYGSQDQSSFHFIVDLVSKALVKTIKMDAKTIDSHGLSFCTHSDRYYAVLTARVSATLDILALDDYTFKVSNFNLKEHPLAPNIQPDYTAYFGGRI